MTSSSLRARLTWLIILVQVAVLIPLGTISYQRELHEMNQLLDGRLAQAGRTLGTLIAYGHGNYGVQDPAKTLQLATEAQKGTVVVSVHPRNYEPEVGFQAYDPQRKLVAATANLADLPPPAPGERGFHEAEYNGVKWRLFTLTNRFDLTVRIGERADNRSDITRGLILEHALPLIIGLPLLAVLAGLAVKQGLKPLGVLTAVLAQREPGSRKLISIDRSPDEIKPLIETLNQQLERLEDAVEREHRFAGDVAHELRTPLAATMIHMESALIADDPAEVQYTVGNARRSLVRLGRRIEQILAIARLEAGAASQHRVPLDLVMVATEVIEELAPVIAEKDISLSLNHEEPELWVSGHEVALTAMFRNLIENALRYTPERGQVDVAVCRLDGKILIAVSDDGPGIPKDRREAAFQRGYRGADMKEPGYGLGLSIVQRAVELHDGSIALLEAPSGNGLLVHILMDPLTDDASKR
ncbi:ATP-binding protein [Luteibacter sp. 22Crub2.1]|uniref:ATP-binding protein n=1 Tax=Luteibacter sp. 22Crub2.1 TaxID=1283288 RepID=UPI0009A61FEC|nr:ATP-binding protein [Luteibacter sp. 22Crub2.1]SKB30805.1 two-component system, OmpR family, sensor histidine kinase QseC [Luteibacter sp. 22Crub2.1]